MVKHFRGRPTLLATLVATLVFVGAASQTPTRAASAPITGALSAYQTARGFRREPRPDGQ